MNRLRRRLLLVVGALLAFGVLAEIALRIYDGARGVSPQSHNFAYFLFRPHPYRGYALTPGLRLRFAGGRTVTVNSRGLRGPEFELAKAPGALRVACLGESSTYGLYETDEDVWPRRLEGKLRGAFPGRTVEVLNAGVPGYSSYESLIYLVQEIVSFEPDVVLVYHTWNDAIKVGTIGATGALPSTGILRERHVDKHGPLRDLLNASALFGLFENRVLDRWWVHRHEGAWFYERLFDEGNVEPDLRAFERNLRTIARTASDERFLAVFCTQIVRPPQGGVFAQWARFLPRCEEIVRRVSREPGAALVDAAASVEATPERFSDSVHFTPVGSEAMAGFLAERLRAILPPGTR